MRLIDVATFTFPGDAAVLESILIREGVEYSLNYAAAAIIVPGDGVTISIKESDVPRVVEIIKEAGFENNLLV